MPDKPKSTEEHDKLSIQFDNIQKYFLRAEPIHGHVPDAWKTPEEKAEAEMEPDYTARAQEIAEALRRDWGFDMRSPRGINWLSRVIGELKA